MTNRPVTKVDVAVIGAGISGLTAARRLHDAGASVLVLEARPRVGGKMYTVEIEGCPVDLGAHWIGPSQRRIGALAAELGLESEPQYLEGRHLLTLGDRRHEFTGATPLTSPAGTAETALAVTRVEVRRRLVDIERPWTSRGAAKLDAVTLAHWMRGLRSATARGTFEIVARTVFGAEPSEVSLLYFLWYVQSAGGYRPLTEFEGAAQDARLAGGSQQVCEQIASELGEAVVLDSPVRAVEQDGDRLAVRSDHRDVTAAHVIAAVAPALAGRIALEPPLPAREALAQRMPMGAYMKGVAVYERAWWRDRGLSGVAFADRGPVQMVVDDSPPGGEPGVLVAFVTGAPARELGQLDAAGRRRAVLDALATAVASEAARPTAYRDFNWLAEPWSRGGPVGVMGPGALTGFGPFLREPVGRLHWAGTETATEWSGYMDGGIQAGERAAGEVLAELGRV